MRPPAVALTALALLPAGCDRGALDARRQRLLSLIDTLPRLEAEERVWPRSPTLACDERAEARAREIDALRDELDGLTANLPARPALRVVLQACDELKGCARCGDGFAAHCLKAEDLLVETRAAVEQAGLR